MTWADERALGRLGRLVGRAGAAGLLQAGDLGDRHIPPRLAARRGHHRTLFRLGRYSGERGAGDVAVSHQRREEHAGVAAAVEGCRAADLGGPLLAGGLEEPVGPGYLPAEVAGVQWGAPDGLVDAAQVADAEWLGAERRRDGGVFELGSGPFQCLAQDGGVVEGKLGL